MTLNEEKSSDLARFLMAPKVFNILKLLAERDEGMDLNQLAEVLELSKSVVLAILHEAWELGVVEPIAASSTTDVSQPSSADKSSSENIDNFELSRLLLDAESSLLSDLPLRDFLERQAFLISASKELDELKQLDVPEFDTAALTPLMRTALDHRVKSGIKTLFHLSPWVRDIFSQVSSAEEMKEYLKQRGLLR